MSYRSERESFIVRMANEGLPYPIILALLRAATTLQRYAELACSSEAADRDRVPCPAMHIVNNKGYARPGSGPCLCDDYPAGNHALGLHSKVNAHRGTGESA